MTVPGTEHLSWRPRWCHHSTLLLLTPQVEVSPVLSLISVLKTFSEVCLAGETQDTPDALLLLREAAYSFWREPRSLEMQWLSQDEQDSAPLSLAGIE